jgi:hypothetical protein
MNEIESEVRSTMGLRVMKNLQQNNYLNLKAAKIKQLPGKSNKETTKVVIDVTTPLPTQTEDDVIFPKETIKTWERESIPMIIFLDLFIIMIQFSSFSFKAFLTNSLQIPISCDIRSNWTEFDDLVLKGNYTLYYPANCTLACDVNNGYITSKITLFNYFLTIFIGFITAMLHVYHNIKKKYLVYVQGSMNLCLAIIFNVIFWNNRNFAFLFAYFSWGLGFIFVYLAEAKPTIKCSINYFVVYIYLGAMQFFYNYAFPYFISLNKSASLAILPLFNFIINSLSERLLIMSYLKRISIYSKYMTCFLSFGFTFNMNVGALHSMVNDGWDSFNIWFNILFGYIIDISTKFEFNKRVWYWLMNRCIRKTKERIEIGDKDEFLVILHSVKTECEILSILLYSIVILFKTFDLNMTFTDCFGRPITNICQINSNHYLLILLLSISVVIQCINEYLLCRYKFHNVNYFYVPKCYFWETFLYKTITSQRNIILSFLPGLYTGIYTSTFE